MSAEAGGIELLVEESHDLPLARLAVTLRGGSSEDPLHREGLAQFAAELARRGAAGKTRAEVDARFDALGAELSVSVGLDAVTFDVEVLERHVDRALALLAEVVLRPDLPAREAEQLRRETHAALDELLDDDAPLARRFFTRALFGAHPYGKPSLGTRASIDRLDGDASRRWIERAVASGNVIVGAAGAITEERFANAVRRRFGALRPGGGVPAELPAIAWPGGARHRLTLVDKPGRTQSQIFIGQPIVAWSHPDFLPLSVATNAFGGTFTARLMTEVRVKRGLSYGVSARMGQGRGPRGLQVYVFPAIDRTGETLKLVLDLWRDWVDHGLTDDEVHFARDNLAASFAFDMVTPEDRLDLRIAMRICNLPPDYLTTLPSRVRALDAAAIRAAMQRHLRAEGLTLTLLSTAAKVRKQLAELDLEGDLTAIPFDSY